MIKQYLKYAVILMVSFSMTGCATVLTSLSPLQSEVVVKDKKPGEVKGYTYHYDVQGDKVYVTKTPMCGEIAEAERVAQKREIGYSPAMLEMAFFGLGLVDIVSAHGIAENSKKVYPLGEYETGKIMACGKPEPAANETLVIESGNLRIYRKVRTNNNGMVDLDKAINNVDGAVTVMIYPENNQTAILSYTYQPRQTPVNATAQNDVKQLNKEN